MKFALILFISISLPAFAGDCRSLTGHYKLSEAGCVLTHNGSSSSSVQFTEFSILGKNDAIVLTINPNSDQHSSYTQHFIANGLVQAGDPVNTGDSYTANCEENIFNTRGLFKILKFPMIRSYQLNGNQLRYVQTFEDQDYFLDCSFDKI